MDVTAIYTGLRTLLNVSSVQAKVGTRIYKKQAPPAVEFPFLIYYIAAGGYQNDSAARLINVIITVEARGTSDKLTTEAWEAANALLHHGALTITGYNVMWLAGERMLDLPPEDFKGVQYFRVGMDYRLMAEKTGA